MLLPGRNPKPPKGFVLILVLVLLSLVTILVVASAIMARIERRASWNSARVELARQNALFALNVALAQLQREAGPDQRVTARADILSSGTSIYQPTWTGVWKTFNPTAGPQPLDSGTTTSTPSSSAIRPWSTNPNLVGGNTSNYVVDAANPNMAWLVSGGTNNAMINPTVSSTAAWISNSVILARNLAVTGSTGAVTGTSAVYVPLVPVVSTSPNKSGTLGKYGYWVSDEGVKAKVNLTDPTFGVAPQTSGSSFVQNQLHFMMPQGIAISNSNGGLYPAGAGPLLGSGNQTDIRSDPNLTKISTLQSLNLLPELTGLSGTTSSPFSVDATTYGYGVLSDAAHGGVKTDLSALFEDNGTETPSQWQPFLASLQSPGNDAAGDAKVFSIGADSFTADNTEADTIFGVRWQSLYNYYNLYRQSIPYSAQTSGSSPYAGLAAFSGNNPATPSPTMNMRAYSYNTIPTPGGTATGEMGEFYYPQLAGIGIYFYLSSEIVGSGTSATSHTYQLRLWAEPRIVLYNPYNVTITTPTSNTYIYNYSLSTNLLSMGANWTISVGGSNVETSKPLTWTGANTSGTLSTNNLQFTTGTNSNFVFKPAELRVFGLGTAAKVQSGYQCVYTGGSGATATSTLGSNAGQSQWAYLPPDNSITANTAWSAVVSDTAAVSITYNPGGAVLTGEFRSNDGRMSISSPPAVLLWPMSSNGWTHLGRFFGGNPPEPTQSVSLGQIIGIESTSSGTEFGYFVLRMKGVQQSQTNGQGSVMPVFASADGFLSPLAKYYDNGAEDIDFNIAQNPTSATEFQVGGNLPDLNTYWGNHDVALNSSDPNAVILRDIPRQPMISLGQFMHMPMRNSMNDGSGAEVEENNTLQSVGGSLCDPFIPLSQSWYNFANNGQFLMDDNFQMNQALFDSYFFSSVPPSSADAAYMACFPGFFSGATSLFTPANITNQSITLPDARMRIYWKNGSPPISTAALQTGTTAAASLMLNGAFNVNSTSVAAWQALLSSLSGNSTNYLNNGAFSSISPSTLENPIFRFLSPVSVDGGTTVNTAWGGTHALSNAQVLSLAQQIVAQVRQRGPFLSMADFLNRRLDANTNTSVGLGFKGALQAAIDNTSINTGTGSPIGANIAATGPMTTGTQVEISRFNFYGQTPIPPNTLPTSSATGIPGWLMQQDIVQCFSPVMTVRSDTFVVRCYGEADNQITGTPEGRAWCEAVVQRCPDYIDQTNSDATPVYNWTSYLANGKQLPSQWQLVTNTNFTFGRRFKIVAFRWLNETDL